MTEMLKGREKVRTRNSGFSFSVFQLFSFCQRLHTLLHHMSTKSGPGQDNFREFENLLWKN
jgi:hypothetical protein